VTRDVLRKHRHRSSEAQAGCRWPWRFLSHSGERGRKEASRANRPARTRLLGEISRYNRPLADVLGRCSTVEVSASLWGEDLRPRRPAWTGERRSNRGGVLIDRGRSGRFARGKRSESCGERQQFEGEFRPGAVPEPIGRISSWSRSANNSQGVALCGKNPLADGDWAT
jgi:hypothetical protein